jgi:acyl-CoA synthetase (NDP forming)/RimJ/RimL family protein N-acetyltransferase
MSRTSPVAPTKAAAIPAEATTFVLLADGRSVQLRRADETDRDELRALHERASDESIYRRFFSASRTAAEAFVEVICTPSTDGWSLVAVHEGHVVGVASASVIDATTAEIALLVDDSLQGKGVATALLEQLRRDARRRGFSTFAADVLVGNVRMLRVLHDAGFSLHEQRDHGVVSLTMDLTVTPAAAAASAWRQRHAQARSLAPLIQPTSVAVLGVSRRRGRVGREVLENILGAGFVGPVFAVGHRDLSVPGVTCLTGTEELPPGLDLVVVALPGPQLERTLQLAAGRGARCCVVLTAGLGEAGREGSAVERRLSQLAREHDMRLVGPNCFGVSSRLSGSTLDATFGRARPRPGSLAVASQSGGVGIALMDAAQARGKGLACFVSLGNMADVSGSDLLAAWTDDPGVDAAALYLESFHDPREFARTAATFSRQKPLLVVFGGSSMAGTRAGASHTASSATPARAIQALFRAAGAVDVGGVQELIDTAALLTEQPLPSGPRLGIVGNAGGLGIVAADSASRCHLEVPELEATTRSRLASAVPRAAGTTNPVDLGASAGADSFAEATRVLLRSGEVDALLLIAVDTAITDMDSIRRAVETATADTPAVPCLSVFVGTDTAPCHTTRFGSVEDATNALAHAVRYSAWRAASDPRGPLSVEGPVDEADTGPPADEGPGQWLDQAAAETVLSSVGVACAPWRPVRTDRDVEKAIRVLGRPLVAKTGAVGIVHKTDRGLVHTGLTTRRMVLDAVHGIQALCGADEPVLLQRELSGPELAVGLVHDARVGPLVMVASGGTSLDLWADQTYLMPPLAVGDVRSALKGLRTWPLLNGFRGSQVLDIDATVGLVMAVGRLALERPDVREIDLNPVIVTSAGPVCVDAKIRVRGPGASSPR